MSSSMHVDNKNKYILVLGESPTQGLDGTTITAEAKYSINFTTPGERFLLSFHLLLVLISVIEVVTLLMIHMLMFVL